MHNLVLDIGNTNGKVAVFKEREMVYHQSVHQVTIELLEDLMSRFPIDHSSVSSVSADLAEVIQFLKEKSNYVQFSTALNTGVKNHYQSIATLGQDRWAKVLAAHSLYPAENCFMIDAGTCITYDLLNDKAEYYGGSISLGIQMRFQALNHFTGRLPLVDWSREDLEIPGGRDTTSAIKSGVLQGAVNEIEGFIAQQNNDNKDLKVIITGGDAAFLLVQLKKTIFAPQIIHDPYLVLKGLNEVIAFEYVQKN